MKTIIFSSLTLVTIFLCSCSSDQNNLVGKWESVDGDGFAMEFKKGNMVSVGYALAELSEKKPTNFYEMCTISEYPKKIVTTNGAQLDEILNEQIRNFNRPARILDGKDVFDFLWQVENSYWDNNSISHQVFINLVKPGNAIGLFNSGYGQVRCYVILSISENELKLKPRLEETVINLKKM